jgi:hypothetical protein
MLNWYFVLDNFKFRNQLTALSKADALGTLINEFLDPEIDLSPTSIDNHAMGPVFEELVIRLLLALRLRLRHSRHAHRSRGNAGGDSG